MDGIPQAKPKYIKQFSTLFKENHLILFKADKSAIEKKYVYNLKQRLKKSNVDVDAYMIWMKKIYTERIRKKAKKSTKIIEESDIPIIKIIPTENSIIYNEATEIKIIERPDKIEKAEEKAEEEIVEEIVEEIDEEIIVEKPLIKNEYYFYGIGAIATIIVAKYYYKKIKNHFSRDVSNDERDERVEQPGDFPRYL